MTEEAVDQEGVLTQEDLARLLQTGVRTVRRDVAQLRSEGHWVPTRGAVQDTGRGQSHKAKIVEMYLQRMTYSEIARRARHSASSIKRYVQTFGRGWCCGRMGSARRARSGTWWVSVRGWRASTCLCESGTQRISMPIVWQRSPIRLDGPYLATARKKGAPMSPHGDRYKTIGQRDFGSAVEYLIETEFKLVGSHRVIRMMVESIMELHREFFPETQNHSPGTIVWATTKAGDGAKVSWGKRAEAYGTQIVHLPLVTKDEIESRMKTTPGQDAANNRRKETQRDRHPWFGW
ncbi:MAG: DUF1670 domain-containing protein [bacterium]|nr:DUF1670 domain-containing protein [bacterium]